MAERRNIFGRVFPPDPTRLLSEGDQIDAGTVAHPVPGKSLLASAARITGKTVADSTFRRNAREEWQDDAWAMFDLVGEQRFLATTIAQRASQARFFVGKLTNKQGEAPVQVDDPKISGILDAIGDGQAGLAQLVQRQVTNLFITGDGWLVGIPKELIPGTPEFQKAQEQEQSVESLKRVNRTLRTTDAIDLDKDGVNTDLPTLDAMVWRMLSVSEIEFQSNSEIQLMLGPASEEKITVTPDDVYLIRVWRPHPRHFWQADSPTRSSLSVLRELVGLTMHISANIDSRLAGAGMLVIAESASRAMKRAMNIPEDSEEDPFTEALMTAMLTPISDRSNASAVVPLVATVPDDVVDKFNYITFAKPLDTESRPLRDEAIRRLALGQDAPPELLLGAGGMNHWGAWLVREDVVSAHLEPPLALICDALTAQYLRPVLVENEICTEDESEQYVIWYDVDHMIIRPNRSEDAKALYTAGVISDAALRDAAGFQESDAPKENTDDPAIVAVFDMVKDNPGLMKRPGLDVLVAQLRALLAGSPLGALDGATTQQAAQEISGTDQQSKAAAPATPGAPARPAAVTPVPPTAPRAQGGVPPTAEQAPIAAGAMTDTFGTWDEVDFSRTVLPHTRGDGIEGSLSRRLAEAGTDA